MEAWRMGTGDHGGWSDRGSRVCVEGGSTAMRGDREGQGLQTLPAVGLFLKAPCAAG